jgi:hypothetical protein
LPNVVFVLRLVHRAFAIVGGLTAIAHASAQWCRRAGLSNKSSRCDIGGHVVLLHLLHEKHATNTKNGQRWFGHVDDCGGGGKTRVGPPKGIEDESVIGHDGVIFGEGISELLLAAIELVDEQGTLHKLTEFIVKVDGPVSFGGG